MRDSEEKSASKQDVGRVYARWLQTALLAFAIFALDTIITVDVVVPVLYVNVILLVMRAGRAHEVMVAGWASIILTVVSFLVTVDLRHIPPTTLLNNALSLLVLFCVMVLCVRTIRFQAEAARARDRTERVSRRVALEALSASVVHDITQPLAAMGANASATLRWLDRTPPDLDEAIAATRRIVAGVERASSIVSGLRLLMGEGVVAVEVFAVSTVLATALDHLRPALDELDIDVGLTAPSNLMVKGDKTLVEQVVINLIANAVDALRNVEQGGRSMRISAARSSDDAVRISVADSGPGCPADAIEEIFDPFFTTKRRSGMGMGLAVCRSIVDGHGGSIRAHANTPHGLVVVLELPATRYGKG